ncbi:PorV/PorQ family protein [Candidatus Ruminimicrobium bovinum]|uniref:PorV/PorQ family protein n=1 Tax=Candidatus Ruminimicrobium bovinum TaxID=3242779 RepID=UPI0039B9D0CD
MKLKFAAVLFLILCLVKFSSAADVGTTSFQVLTLPMSAYDASLSNISIAGISSSPSNPAIMPYTSYYLLFSHAIYLADTNYNVLSFNLPVTNKSSIGVSITYFDLGSMQKTIETSGGYIIQGDFSANDKIFTFSYGHKINDDITAGASIKYLKQEIDDIGYSAVAFTLSGLYFIDDKMYCGAGLNNIGNAVNSYNLPTNLYFSFLYHVLDYLTGIGELNAYYNDNIYELKLALEASYQKLKFRCGYKIPLNYQQRIDLQNELLSNFSLGFGLNLDFLSIDYAWLPKGDLGNIHMFSVGVEF